MAAVLRMRRKSLMPERIEAGRVVPAPLRERLDREDDLLFLPVVRVLGPVGDGVERRAVGLAQGFGEQRMGD